MLAIEQKPVAFTTLVIVCGDGSLREENLRNVHLFESYFFSCLFIGPFFFIFH